jgi:hypothetical protein
MDCSLLFVVDHGAHGWTITLTFDSVLSRLDCWQASVSTTDWRTFRLVNLAWDGDFTPGAVLDLKFQPRFEAGRHPHLIAADMDGQDICGNGPSTAATSTAPPYTTTPEATTSTSDPDDGSVCSHVVSVIAADPAQHTTVLSILLTPAIDIQAWVVDLTFRAGVNSLESPLADVTGSGTVWRLANKSWDGGIAAGQTLELVLSVHHEADVSCPPVVGVCFSGTLICGGEA